MRAQPSAGQGKRSAAASERGDKVSAGLAILVAVQGEALDVYQIGPNDFQLVLRSDLETTSGHQLNRCRAGARSPHDRAQANRLQTGRSVFFFTFFVVTLDSSYAPRPAAPETGACR